MIKNKQSHKENKCQLDVLFYNIRTSRIDYDFVQHAIRTTYLGLFNARADIYLFRNLPNADTPLARIMT